MRRWLPSLAAGVALMALAACAAQEKAAPIELIRPQQMKKGGSIHMGTGGVPLFSRARHPNAAKVYINWLLTKETQEALSKASGDPATRVDVAKDHVEPASLPRPDAVDTYSEAALDDRPPMLRLLQEVLGR